MKLHTTPYLEQQPLWPQSGHAIMAQFDQDSIVVYQAYRPAIGHFAAHNGYFGGPFKMTRMTWIKPNFLWMMYRSGWGTKEGQEVTLAIRLKRTAFDHILANAVHSSFVPDLYPTREVWKEAVATSDVRLQWDPDHDPSGAKVERRAIQLGLRGQTVAQYACDWIVDIQDISSFVAQQRRQAQTGDYRDLWTPTERPYPVTDPEVASKLGCA